MADPKVSRYPEHDKLMAVKDESQALGEFLDVGLRQLGLVLCKQVPSGSNGEAYYVWRKGHERPVPPDMAAYLDGRAKINLFHESWGAQYVASSEPIQQLLARYFDIDLDKIEAEKSAMLDALCEPARAGKP